MEKIVLVRYDDQLGTSHKIHLDLGEISEFGGEWVVNSVVNLVNGELNLG